MEDITGEELAALLHNIHTHAELLVNEGKIRMQTGMSSSEYMDNPDEIVYREEDLLKVLKAIGLPDPVWGKSMTIKEFSKSRL